MAAKNVPPRIRTIPNSTKRSNDRMPATLKGACAAAIPAHTMAATRPASVMAKDTMSLRVKAAAKRTRRDAAARMTRGRMPRKSWAFMRHPLPQAGRALRSRVLPTMPRMNERVQPQDHEQRDCERRVFPSRGRTGQRVSMSPGDAVECRLEQAQGVHRGNHEARARQSPWPRG